MKDPNSDPFSYLGIEDTAKTIVELIDCADVGGTNKWVYEVPPDPFVGAVPAAGIQNQDLFVLGTNSSSTTASGQSTGLADTHIACKPRIERLRCGEHRLPASRLPTRCYADPASSVLPYSSPILVASTHPYSQPISLSTMGHKHNLSEDSAIHPDSANRSRTSPCPLPTTETDLSTHIPYTDTTLQQAHHLSGLSFMDDQFLCALDTELDPSSFYTISGQPPNIIEWDERHLPASHLFPARFHL